MKPIIISVYLKSYAFYDNFFVYEKLKMIFFTLSCILNVLVITFLSNLIRIFKDGLKYLLP